MKKLGILLSIISILIVGKAFASPCMETFPCDARDEAIYAGVFGGANWLHSPHVDEAKVGFFTGGAVGYQFEAPFRLEGEVAFRRNCLVKINSDDKSKLRVHSHTWSYLGNLYYDFDCLYQIKPYLGIGMGYAQQRTYLKLENVASVEGSAVNVSVKGKRERGFAWQAIAGIAYPICDKVDLGLEYRFFDARARGRDHCIGLGLKRFF